MLDYKVQMKVEGLLRYCAQNGCGLLFTDGTNTVENIRKVKCNKKLEKDILEVLKDHTLMEKECKEILKKHDAKQIELLKIILKNKLKYQSYPFKLELCCYENELFYQVFYKKKRYDDLMKRGLRLCSRLPHSISPLIIIIILLSVNPAAGWIVIHFNNSGYVFFLLTPKESKTGCTKVW